MTEAVREAARGAMNAKRCRASARALVRFAPSRLIRVPGAHLRLVPRSRV
jgi:hypothetical protein